MAKRPQPIEPLTLEELDRSSEPAGEQFGDFLRSAPALRDRNASAPNASAPKTSAPSIDQEYVYKAPREPVAWRKVQDAHTHGEQSLYAAMYRLAKPCGEGTRKLVIGARTLAKEVPMAYSNCRANIRSLHEKLSIEDCGPAGNDGRSYLIFEYEVINDRRRKAGLTHILRTTRKVDLVAGSAPGFGALGLRAPSLSAVRLGKAGAPSLKAPSSNYLEEEVVTSSSIVDAAGRLGVMLDDGAAIQIIRRCRELEPTATEAEIAYFLDMKIHQLRKKGNIENMPGLLITSVCEFFKQPHQLLTRLRREQESTNAQ